MKITAAACALGLAVCLSSGATQAESVEPPLLTTFRAVCLETSGGIASAEKVALAMGFRIGNGRPDMGPEGVGYVMVNRNVTPNQLLVLSEEPAEDSGSMRRTCQAIVPVRDMAADAALRAWPGFPSNFEFHDGPAFLFRLTDGKASPLDENNNETSLAAIRAGEFRVLSVITADGATIAELKSIYDAPPT